MHYLKLYNKMGKHPVIVIGKGLFLSLFGEIHMRQLEVVYKSFPKVHVRLEGFHFMVPVWQTRELTLI